MIVFIKKILATVAAGFLILLALSFSTLWYFSIDLPDYKILANYEPPVSSRVYSGEGQLIAEYAYQKRFFIPFESVPKKLIVIGGGYIGLELSSVWQRLGSSVTVIEYLDHILPGMDKDISNEFLKILTKQGIDFKLDNEVTAVNVIKDKAVIDFTNKKSAKRERVECDKVLVAVGRKPNIGNKILNLDIKLDKQKKIKVNEKFQTSVKNIYAIGDVIDKGPMLAHKAEDEGIAVAEIIAG